MGTEIQPADKLLDALDSVMLVCAPSDRAAVTTAVAVAGAPNFTWAADVGDDEAAMVFAMQSLFEQLANRFLAGRTSERARTLWEQCGVAIHRLIEGVNLVPRWDAARRELEFCGQIVKRYRVPAQNQETILAAFQEEGWPRRILDPLPATRDQDQRRKLNLTIQSLNRHHLTRAIRFGGDGTGSGVTWQFHPRLATARANLM